LSEERQLNGYRVRLRVVEEYDVALLAESPDDAKARAEADLRRGERFEDIQDSWPEEIVSLRSAVCGAVPGTRVDGAARGAETEAAPPTSSGPTQVVNAWLRLITTMNPCLCRVRCARGSREPSRVSTKAVVRQIQCRLDERALA
jgi:hypothetical protein